MARVVVRYCAHRVSGLHAVRAAARLGRELQIEVETEHGRYGEFKVLIDGELVVDGGIRAALYILPSGRTIVAAVRQRLSA
jgi:hypothetical protein